MTDDQPPPGGRPLDPGGPLPPGRDVITVAGPWTVLSCVTAACTSCGAAPADEDTGMTPHFASTSQAAQELAQNWGWHHEHRSEWPKDDVLLCPACAKAGDDSGKPAVAADSGNAPGTAPQTTTWWAWKTFGQAWLPGLPPNTAVPPAGSTQEEG